MRKLIFGAFMVLCIGATVTSITTTNLKDLPSATSVFGTNQMVGLTNNTTARLFTVNQVSNAIRGAFGGGGISVAAGTNVLLTTNLGLVTINGLTDTNIVELRARIQATNVVNNNASPQAWTNDPAGNILSSGTILKIVPAVDSVQVRVTNRFIVIGADGVTPYSIIQPGDFAIGDTAGSFGTIVDVYGYRRGSGGADYVGFFQMALDVNGYGGTVAMDPANDNGLPSPFLFSTSYSNSLVATHHLFDIANSHTNKLSVMGNGDLYWGADATIGYRPPATNGSAGQALVTDGGTPQQLSYQSFFPSTSLLSASRSTDATSTSTAMASTGLSRDLVAGMTYTFQAQLFLSDSVAADGAKIDFNGGSATATTFIAQVTAFDTALNLSTQLSALNGAASASTFTGAGSFEVHGTIFVDAGGTFIPQFAQVAHTAGTLTLKKGSFLRVFQTN